MNTGSCRCYHYTAAISAGSYLYYYFCCHSKSFLPSCFLQFDKPIDARIHFLLLNWVQITLANVLHILFSLVLSPQTWLETVLMFSENGLLRLRRYGSHPPIGGSLVRFLAPAVTCWSVLGKNPIWARWLLHLCVSVHMNGYCSIVPDEQVTSCMVASATSVWMSVWMLSCVFKHFEWL